MRETAIDNVVAKRVLPSQSVWRMKFNLLPF
jgi:hypothetical protein